MDTNTTLPRLRRLWKLAAEREAEVWWRHDVDFDVACAVQMAEMEHENAIVSTFFFLTDAYLLCKDDLQKILDFGHEIAPHVDLHGDRDSKYTDVQLFDACQDALDALMFVIQPVEVAASFHQPPADVIGREIPGFESAQGPAWQDCQTADSRGGFILTPEQLMRREGSVQINLHPEWWFWPSAKQAEYRAQEATKP